MSHKPKLTQQERRQVVQSVERAKAKGGRSVSAKSVTKSRTVLEAAVLRRRKKASVARSSAGPVKKLPLRPKRPRDPFASSKSPTVLQRAIAAKKKRKK